MGRRHIIIPGETVVIQSSKRNEVVTVYRSPMSIDIKTYSPKRPEPQRKPWRR